MENKVYTPTFLISKKKRLFSQVGHGQFQTL